MFVVGDSSTNMTHKSLSPGVLAALESVRFIAQHIRDADKDNEVLLFDNFKNCLIKLILY